MTRAVWKSTYKALGVGQSKLAERAATDPAQVRDAVANALDEVDEISAKLAPWNLQESFERIRTIMHSLGVAIVQRGGGQLAHSHEEIEPSNELQYNEEQSNPDTLPSRIFISPSQTDKNPFPDSITERLALLDERVFARPGEPVSDYARSLFPELATIEARQKIAKDRPPPPKIAPALWEKDRRPDDTPMSFFMRTYGPWIGQLYAGELRRLDQKGYDALRYFLKSADASAIPEGFSLPTKREANKLWIDHVKSTGELPAVHGADPARDLSRLAAAMRRSQAKDR